MTEREHELLIHQIAIEGLSYLPMTINPIPKASVEVLTIHSCYQGLPESEKIGVLRQLQSWVNNELGKFFMLSTATRILDLEIPGDSKPATDLPPPRPYPDTPLPDKGPTIKKKPLWRRILSWIKPR